MFIISVDEEYQLDIQYLSLSSKAFGCNLFTSEYEYINMQMA